MLNVVILVITCVVNFILGLLVLLRNPKSITGRAFFLITLFVSAWAVSNYITELEGIDLTVNQIANRLAFFFAFLAISLGLRFVVNFLGSVYLGFGRVVDLTLTIVGTVTAILSLTPLIAGSVDKNGDGSLAFSVGPFLFLYVVVITLFIGLIFWTLRRIIKRTLGKERQQASFILAGFTITPILALLTNAIIPIATDSWHTSAIGPLFTVLLVGSVSYAIVRHKLFDIRLAVARALGYFFSVAAVVALYSILIFSIAEFVFDLSLGVKQEIVLVLVTSVMAFFFQPIKLFFNRISNKIFYRDAYDPQAALDELSNALVRSSGVDMIKKQSARILKMTLRSTSFEFALFAMQDEKDKDLLNGLAQFSGNTVDTDELSDHAALRKTMNSYGVNLAVKLRTTHETLGFIVLGHKQSGELYSTQDKRMLGIAADEIATSLQNALRFQQIERFNKTLQEKIEDATRELRRKNDRLRVLDQTKDDFISMASHQLRTPLTSVKGYVSMVLDGDAGKVNELQKKLLTQSFLSSQRMVYLISDLLNVSRLRTGKFVIEPVEANLADVIEGEVEQLQETAKGRELTLSYKKPEHFPILMIDETKLRQVIMNFIDNAIYYTPGKGHITVNLVDRPDAIEFTVVDNGIGVPKAEQHHLFSKFYRAHNAKRTRPDGTGLGLFMAKKVIIAQGGAIIFRSQEGKGSTFGFTFPKKKLLTTDKMQAENSKRG